MRAQSYPDSGLGFKSSRRKSSFRYLYDQKLAAEQEIGRTTVAYELDNVHKMTGKHALRLKIVRFTCAVPVLVTLLSNNDHHAAV